MIDINSEISDVESHCIAYRGLAAAELYRGHFSQSEEYVLEALETAVEYDLPEEKMKCYRLLADLATARHDYLAYRMYAEKSDSIGNALISEQTRLNAKEMEAKYETEKKDSRLNVSKASSPVTGCSRGYWRGPSQFVPYSLCCCG